MEFIIFFIFLIIFSMILIINLIKVNGPLNMILIFFGITLLGVNVILIKINPNNKLFIEASGLTGGALIIIACKNILTKEDNLKIAGEWRKNLYKLEQKSYYTIDDLYELNSYINPYSQKNKVSIIVNEVIVSILKNYNNIIDEFENTELETQKNILLCQKKKITDPSITSVFKFLFKQEFYYILIMIIYFCICYFFKLSNNYDVWISIIFIIYVFIIMCIQFKDKRKKIKEIDETIKQIDETIEDDRQKIKQIDEIIEDDRQKTKYINLKILMKNYLKTNNISQLKLNDNEKTNLTAFDFKVNHKITNKRNRKYNTYTIYEESSLNLTPEENNLVRLSCHVLLRADWKEWSN